MFVEDAHVLGDSAERSRDDGLGGLLGRSVRAEGEGDQARGEKGVDGSVGALEHGRLQGSGESLAKRDERNGRFVRRCYERLSYRRSRLTSPLLVSLG